MKDLLPPLKKESLTDVFVRKFEELIFSGRFKIGQKLPSERELALQLGVSRPVVHEGLVDLSFKGLVTMTPRVGTVVNDYRREGSLAVIHSLFNYHRGDVSPELLHCLLRMRELVEIETARLAALHREESHLDELDTLVRQEKACDSGKIEERAELDFRVHHTVAMAGGNLVYPLMMNSFKPLFTNISGRFFALPEVAATVLGFHEDLLAAITERNPAEAVDIMKRLLAHGETHVVEIIARHERRTA